MGNFVRRIVPAFLRYPVTTVVAFLFVDRFLKVLAMKLPPVSADFSFVEFAFKAARTTNVLGIVPLGSTVAVVLVSVALIGLAVSVLVRRPYEPSTLFSLPYTIVFLGGASNLYDRLVHGAVIDVFQIRLGLNLGVFNIADVMIVVGMIGLISRSVMRNE